MMTDTEQSDWQMGRSGNECMGLLFKKKLWTDIRFRCKDQDAGNTEERIQAHKVVLTARSPVFQAMFFGPCADTSSEILLSDTDSEIFKLFLMYVYSDQTDLSEETVPAVMQIAHKYQVSSLLSYCSSYLTGIIRVDNACVILELALFFEEKKLEQVALNYIDDHGEKVLKTDGFYEMQLSTLEYLIKGDTFLARERYIFNATMRWADKKCSSGSLESSGHNLRKAVGSAFKQIRLPTLSAEDFSRLTYRKGYLTFEEMEDTLSFITGNSTVQPYNVVRPRRKRMGDCRPKHIQNNFTGHIEFAHYVNVTSKIRIRHRDAITLTGLTMSSLIKSPIVPEYMNPKTKYNVSVTFIKTLDNDSDLLYPKMYFTNIKTARIQFLDFEHRIELKEKGDVFAMVHIMSYPNAMVYIPEVKPAMGGHVPFEDIDDGLDEEEIGLRVLDATFMDSYRLVDHIKYESPSNR